MTDSWSVPGLARPLRNPHMKRLSHLRSAVHGSLLALVLAASSIPLATAEVPQLDKAVLAAEAERVAVVQRISPAVCAVCIYGGQAVGSGVVIDPEGYALTNHHVVGP